MLTLLFIACAQGPEYERGYNDGCDMAILDAESCLDADIPVAEDEYGNGVLAGYEDCYDMHWSDDCMENGEGG